MSEPFIGEIMMVGFNFPPRGWATCDGQLLSIASNSALFSLLGTTFGGDGRTTFALPDLRGRSATHVGSGPGLPSYSWGQRGGNYTKTLTVNEIPSHTHIAQLNASPDEGDSGDPSARLLANTEDPAKPFTTDGTNTTAMHGGSVTVANTGGNQSFNTMPPYLGIYHCIALVGIFPSRN